MMLQSCCTHCHCDTTGLSPPGLMPTPVSPAQLQCIWHLVTLLQGQDGMDQMWVAFTCWQAAVAGWCRRWGCWGDASDPRSGFPVRGSRALRWNEVKGAQLLLGYPIQDEDGICPLLLHPTFGEVRIQGYL